MLPKPSTPPSIIQAAPVFNDIPLITAIPSPYPYQTGKEAKMRTTPCATIPFSSLMQAKTGDMALQITARPAKESRTN
jgi:hypothetical protein